MSPYVCLICEKHTTSRSISKISVSHLKMLIVTKIRSTLHETLKFYHSDKLIGDYRAISSKTK